MSQARANDADSPTSEQLAAYIDGELDAAQAIAVERWICDHPEAAAEIERQRRVAQLWQMTAPVEPVPEKWMRVLERVESELLRPRQPVVARRRLIRVAAAVTVAAAALLLLVWRPTERPVSVEALTVVSPDEVEIVSVRAADRTTLVVGVPPVTGPLVFASPSDVQLERVEPDADGMIPDIQLDENSDTAMIVAPPRGTAGREAPSPER